MRRLALALLPLTLVGGVTSAAAPSVVGIAAAVINDVRIKGAAARQFAKAALRQRVALADQVQTGGGSRLQLVLLDQSKFTVGPNARLTIDRFVYDPNGGSMSASVAKGAFRFMSGRSGGRKDAAINTPAATIGIRGTLLDGVVGADAIAIARGEREIRGNIQHDPAAATLIVLRGPGPRRQGGDAVGAVDVGAGGRTVTLDRPLEAAYVPHAGATPIAFTISSQGIARLNDLLLEPREIVNNPDGPGQPYVAQPERDRPDYDRPGRGGFGDDSAPPRGYNSGNLPGANGFPSGQADRPQRRGTQPQAPLSSTTTQQTQPGSTTQSPDPSGQSNPAGSASNNPSPGGSNPYPSPQASPSPSPSTGGKYPR